MVENNASSNYLLLKNEALKFLDSVGVVESVRSGNHEPLTEKNEQINAIEMVLPIKIFNKIGYEKFRSNEDSMKSVIASELSTIYRARGINENESTVPSKDELLMAQLMAQFKLNQLFSAYVEIAFEGIALAKLNERPHPITQTWVEKLNSNWKKHVENLDGALTGISKK